MSIIQDYVMYLCYEYFLSDILLSRKHTRDKNNAGY